MPIQEDFLPEEYLLKIEQNKRPIVGKDFTDLSEPELKQFISDAKTKYLYYAKDGVNVAYGNVYMYFEQKNELALFEFDKKGSCRENNPRKK